MYVCIYQTYDVKFFIYVGLKTHTTGKITVIHGQKRHVYRVIICKRMANHEITKYSFEIPDPAQSVPLSLALWKPRLHPQI